MRSSKIIIAVALLVGVLAAFLVAKSLGGDGRELIVATHNLLPGQVIGEQDIKLVEWPSSDMPNGAFLDKSLVLGRVARQSVYPGEAILETDLAPVGARGGLEAAIEPGKRAITVRVNDVTAVAGFAHPGSYVDVLVSAKNSKGEQFSMIVLNRVKILAIAQETQSDPATPKVVNAVTLELTPEEAESLDLARTVGNISLVLRNEVDRSISQTGGAQLNALLQRKVDKDAPVTSASVGTSTSASNSAQQGVIEMRGLGDAVK